MVAFAEMGKPGGEQISGRNTILLVRLESPNARVSGRQLGPGPSGVSSRDLCNCELFPRGFGSFKHCACQAQYTCLQFVTPKWFPNFHPAEKINCQAKSTPLTGWWQDLWLLQGTAPSGRGVSVPGPLWLHDCTWLPPLLLQSFTQQPSMQAGGKSHGKMSALLWGAESSGHVSSLPKGTVFSVSSFICLMHLICSACSRSVKT